MPLFFRSMLVSEVTIVEAQIYILAHPLWEIADLHLFSEYNTNGKRKIRKILLILSNQRSIPWLNLK